MDLEGELESEVLLHGEEHPAVARVYNELAHYYIANERYHLALEYFGRAKDLLVRLYGENDEGVIDIDYRIDKLINSQIEALSTTPNQDLKNHRQQTFQRRCQLDADNSVLGLDEHSGRIRNAMPQDYTDSTLVYSDLAEEARLKGKFEEAIRLYLFSINLRRKKFGDKNPALTSVLLHYSDLLQQCENFSEAKSVLEEALAINLHAYGRRHPAVAQVLNELGLVHMRLEGKVLLTRTIDMGMMPASFNKQDERHSLSKGNPAFDRAELLLKEALEIRRELFGDMDLTVAASLNSLAELYREGDDFYQAISYHNLSVEAYERCGGVDHPGTINAKGNLGKLLLIL